VLKEGFHKEISAALEEYSPTELDFTPFFEYSKHRRVTPYVLPSMKTTQYIIGRFDSCRHKLSTSLFYPYMSKKTMGREAKENFDGVPCLWRSTDLEGDGISANTMLRLYHHEGIKIIGTTELRSAWKYNLLTPRIYYAMGPTDFWASCYIQPIFNIILDSFPAVHRRERFYHESIDFANMVAFIYDYSSFTSNLSSLYQFLIHLADFYQDVMITIVDVSYGPMDVSLADLLVEYANVTSKCPVVDLHRFVVDALGNPTDFTHHTGMLGVPGNISASTLLHGLFLMIITSPGFCKCVGDDAIGAYISLTSELYQHLSSLAPLNDEKMDFWDPSERDALDHAWKYLKRPIFRINDRMISGSIFEIPPLQIMLNLPDQYGRIPTFIHDPIQAQKRSAGILRSLLYRVIRNVALTDGEKESVWELCEYVIKKMELDRRDCLFPTKRSMMTGDLEDIVQEYSTYTMFGAAYDYTQVDSDQIDMVVNPSPSLRLAHVLGYGRLEEYKSRYVVCDDPDRFRSFLNRSSRKLYTFTLVETMPLYLKELVLLETSRDF